MKEKIGIILIGPNGSGKGTQGEKLRTVFGFDIIITSDVLKEDGHFDKMKKGILVDDTEVFDSVSSRVIPNNHHVFDGITRTKKQARVFPRMLKEIGFNYLIAIEFDLPSWDIAEERINMRAISGNSDRPDNNDPVIQKNRFFEYQKMINDIRKVLVKNCNEYYVINAEYDLEQIHAELGSIVCQALKDHDDEFDWQRLGVRALENIERYSGIDFSPKNNSEKVACSKPVTPSCQQIKLQLAASG